MNADAHGGLVPPRGLGDARHRKGAGRPGFPVATGERRLAFGIASTKTSLPESAPMRLIASNRPARRLLFLTFIVITFFALASAQNTTAFGAPVKVTPTGG